MEVEAPKTTAEILRRGTDLLVSSLPRGWNAQLQTNPTDRRIDGLIEVVAPDGKTAVLVVEVKNVVEGRDVGAIAAQLQSYLDQMDGTTQGFVVARYLPPPVRERLTDAGLSYADATGNIRIAVSSPGLFVSDRGENKDPWRGPGRPRGTLKGAPAANIARAVTDFSDAWTIRQLVDVAKVSTGAAYRVVEYLEREGLATRNSSGLIEVLDWTEVLRRWSGDYGFTRNNRVTQWIAPRGLTTLIDVIAKSDNVPYAVTGTIAATEWAAYAPARLAMIYVENAEFAASQWDLRPTESGANVLLAEPEFNVVFARKMTNASGLDLASPAQVVVDLMTGPGRNPSEAEELLDWMVRNEQSWRS